MNVSYIYISIAALLCFAMMFAAFFAAKRSRIKKYRDSVSKTPNIDSVLRQTVEVIKNGIHVDRLCICLLQNGRYVPVCSAMPEKPASFTIAADPLYRTMCGTEKELLSHISHEIRTPLSSIAELTYLARELVGEGRDDELREHLERIDRSSQYLLSLLNNIMDMSKIENSRYEISEKPFDISAVLDEVYSVYSATMAAKGVKLDMDTEGLSCPNVLGDELSLRRILNNLLSNAGKFTKTGGSVRLLASQKLPDAQSSILHLEVSDTGIGMSEDFLGRLFEPYTQEQSADGGRAAGSGLGMAICKSMLELQGGTISVKSRQGFGTTFFVDIPYPLCEAPAAEARSIDCSAINGRRVMVVDDVMINTAMIRRLLERHGALVDCAESGREAAELFRSKPEAYYDCILMDIRLPEMNGIEAAACIRASAMRYASTVPILAMTADAFIDEQEGALGDFSGYILKPVKPDELYAKLVGIFENQRGTHD